MDLNKLNKNFYLKTQEYFNTSRQFYWDGWKKLLAYLQGENLQVLDLGCGNGRFGKFLSERKMIDYIGIDNNQYLLDRAAEKLPNSRLIRGDLNKPWPIKTTFNLIALMAVLHHIPTKTARLKILLQAKKLLKSNGLLVFTVWHFNKLKHFRQQVVSPKKFDDSNHRTLEPNDFILDWKKGTKALRYVHLFDNKEIAWLIKELNLKLIDDYVADGSLGQSNRYLVLRK